MLGHGATADTPPVRSLRRSTPVLAGRLPATCALRPLPPQTVGARPWPGSRSVRRHPPPDCAPLQIRPAPHLGGAAGRLDARTRGRPASRCRLRGASTAPSTPAASARLQSGGRVGRASGTAGGPCAPPHRRHEPPDWSAGGTAPRQRPWGLCAGSVASRPEGHAARRLCRAGRRRRDNRGHARSVRPGAARVRCRRSAGAHACESRSPRIALRARTDSGQNGNYILTRVLSSAAMSPLPRSPSTRIQPACSVWRR